MLHDASHATLPPPCSTLQTVSGSLSPCSWTGQVSRVIPYSEPTWQSASEQALGSAFLWHLPLQHVAYIAAAYAAASHACSPAFLADLLHAALVRLRVLLSKQREEERQQRGQGAGRAGAMQRLGVRGGAGGKVGGVGLACE